MRQMRYDEGGAVRAALLSEAGLDIPVPPFLSTWEVYKRFAAIPITEELPRRDSVAFLAVTSEPLDPRPGDAAESFHITLVRQMSRAYSPDRGEDDYGEDVETVEEMFLIFDFPLPPNWEDFELNSWDFPTLAEFFAAAEASEGFRLAMQMNPVGFAVTQSMLY